MGGWMNRTRLERVVNIIRSLKPDIVLLTGDYLVEERRKDQRAALLDELTILPATACK